MYKDKMVHSYTMVYRILFISLIFLNSCSTEEGPLIVSVEPAVGFPTAQIKITGKNFGAGILNTRVEFNGIPARVDSVKPTELFVTIPENATSGSISIKTAFGEYILEDFLCYDIFVGGNGISADEKSIIKVWKNGAPEDITPENHFSTASSFAMANNDFYFSGSINTGSEERPAYWVNTTRHLLPVSGSSFAVDIAINQNGVHVVGQEYYESNSIPRYWRDGEIIELDMNSKESARIYGVAIDNSNVYICGDLSKISEPNTGAIWINGVLQEMGDGTHVLDITAQNGVAHATGMTETIAGSKLTYWNNLVSTHLTDGSFYGDGSVILAKGSYIYIAGTDEKDDPLPTSKLWINNQAFRIAHDGRRVAITGIAAEDGHVFLSGIYNNEQDVDIAFFTIDNKFYLLTDATTRSSSCGIVVKRL